MQILDTARERVGVRWRETVKDRNKYTGCPVTSDATRVGGEKTSRAGRVKFFSLKPPILEETESEDLSVLYLEFSHL